MSADHMYSADELNELNRRDLQKLCKRDDVLAWTSENRPALKANAKNADLIEALQAFFAQIQTTETTTTAVEEAVMEDVAPVVEPIVTKTATPAAVAVVTAPTPVASPPSNPLNDSQSLSNHDISIDTSVPVAEDFPPLIDPEEEAARQQAELEAEIAALEAKRTAAEKQEKKETSKPAATTTSKSNKKSSVVASKSVKVPRVAMIKPSAQPASSPAPAAAAPLFTKKAAGANKKKPITKKTEIAAAQNSPPANSFASAFIIPTVLPVVAAPSASPIAAAAPAAFSTTAAASSSSSGMDAYWTLMAELDKRVVEKQKDEGDSVAVAALAPVLSAGINAEKPKSKTAKKFEAIHNKAAAKKESIVDYQKRLEEKKRQAAAISTPANKKQKLAPTTSTAAAAPAASPAPFTMPATATTFSMGVKNSQITPAVAKRTRSSFKKESAASVVKAPKATIASVKKVAPVVAKKPVAEQGKTLFTSRIPVRPTAAASSSVPLTTFTQIACLGDLPKPSPAKKMKFDLAQSLKKPVTWKAHKGKIVKGDVATKKQQNNKENEMSDVAAPSQFHVEIKENMFTAPSAPSTASNNVLQPIQRQAKSVHVAAARENIKTAKFGIINKDATRAKFESSNAAARQKAMGAARQRLTAAVA